MKHGILLAAALAACSKGHKSDCEAYAAKLADASAPDPSRHDSVRQGALEACNNGRVTAEQKKCVTDASSGADIKACFGLASSDGAPGMAKTSVELVGVEGAGLDPNGKDADWVKQLRANLSGCNPPGAEAAAAFDAKATYGSSITVDVSAAPAWLQRCLTTVLKGATSDVIGTPLTIHLKVTPPPGGAPVPKVEGSPKVEAYAVNQGTSDLDPQAMKDDQKAWFAEIQKNVAACATGDVLARSEPVVVLTYRDKGETWVDAHEVQAPLRDCVEKAVKIPHPDSITHGMSELTIYIGH